MSSDPEKISKIGEPFPNLKFRPGIKKAETLYRDEMMKAEMLRRQKDKPDEDWPDCPDCGKAMDRVCKAGHVYEYVCSCGVTGGEFKGI